MSNNFTKYVKYIYNLKRRHLKLLKFLRSQLKMHPDKNFYVKIQYINLTKKDNCNTDNMTRINSFTLKQQNKCLKIVENIMQSTSWIL